MILLAAVGVSCAILARIPGIVQITVGLSLRAKRRLYRKPYGKSKQKMSVSFHLKGSDLVITIRIVIHYVVVNSQKLELTTDSSLRGIQLSLLQ